MASNEIRRLAIRAKTTDGDESGGGEDGGSGTVIERRTKTQSKTKRPPMFKVILLNDDYTPMEFVVEVLERFFAMDRPTATRVMLEVHTRGKGVCGVFTYEIAETKVSQVTSYSREHQHPLLCTLEEA
jgi:ATP-dependent Clp protease adaptor protein ClpS